VETAAEWSVIYILGRGHSGSTTIDLVLGNHPEAVSVGEITNGFRVVDHPCACSAQPDDCPFWGPIRRAVRERHPDVTWDEYGRMLAFLDIFYRIPAIVTGVGLPGWVAEKYAPLNRDLYAAIAAHAGRPRVVDSSKDLARAVYLITRHRARTKILHVVRDGRGELWSRLKRLRAGKPFQVLRHDLDVRWHWPVMVATAAAWTLANAACVLFRWIVRDRVIQVLYEDLCENPRRELDRIGRFLGLDLSQMARRIEEGEPFAFSHNVSGSVLLSAESKSLTFRPDVAWKERLPRVYRFLYYLFAWPLVLYFGYFRRR